MTGHLLRRRLGANASRSRRRALIAALAAAAAVSAAPAGAAAASPPRPATPIKHLVLLMQANHSFDNYFGTYPGADGIPKGTCQPISLSRPAAGCVRPFHLGGRPVPDLDHPIDVFRRQLNGGRMNGFVAAYRQVGAGTHQSVMGYYDERDLPFSWAVARRYVLFDRFFTSASAGTLANHMFWMTGRRGTNDQDQIPPNGFGNLPTIFDRLQAAGVSWRVYVENYDPGVTYRNRSGPRSSQPSTVPLLAFDRFIDDKRLFGNIVGLDQYYDDLRNGTLPAVSYIVTSASSERPPGSVTAGQQLVRTLVEALISSRSWRTSAFMWTYDDWGGWFDHIKPPQVDRYGYGFRVPALLVSPFARRGRVDHTTLDFTSMLKFIEHNWHLKPLALRDARAKDFLGAFDFSHGPRPAELLPSPETPRARPLKGRGVVYLFYGGALLALLALFGAAVRGERRRRAAGLAAILAAAVVLSGQAGGSTAQAATEVQAVPALPGLRLSFEGQRLQTDAGGLVVVPTDDRRALRAGLRGLDTPLRHGVRARFSGWRRGRLTFRLLYDVHPAFVNTTGRRVDPKRIATITLAGPAGARLVLRGAGAHWIPGNRIVPIGRRPVSRPLAWAVESVTAAGTNVVTRSQQKLVPSRQRHPRIRVRFYSLRFAAQDALLRRSIGSAITLRYPNGHEERHTLGHDGALTLHALPRGLYHVRLQAPGMAAAWPVALSRDQKLEVSVISYLDVALVFGALTAIALGLLIAGQPRLRARLRRAMA